MFDIRTVPDDDLLVAFRHLAGGASHSPLAGRTVTKQTISLEIRRRQLSIDPPPGPAIDTDPRGPYRWYLEVDENDSYLCPMPNGETAGRCRAELVVEGVGWEYLGADCEMARPLTEVAVESWTVRCTNGHVLEIGPNDGNGAPPFRLDRFLTGEGHTVDEDEPTTTESRPSATPPHGLDELIAWADLGIVYKADPRDMAATIKRLAAALRDATPPVTPQTETPSGDYLPLPEMLGLLADAKDRRDAVGARIAKPGVASPELVTEWGEAQTAEWRIVDEIVGQYRATVPGTPEAAARLLGRTDEPLPPAAVQILGSDQADGPAGRWCPIQQMKCWETDCSKGCEIAQPDPAS